MSERAGAPVRPRRPDRGREPGRAYAVEDMVTRSPALVHLALPLALACAPSGGSPTELPPALPAKPELAQPPRPDPTPEVQVLPGALWPEAAPPRDAGEPRAPLSLTASDGTGLQLVSLTARGVVEAPLAFTELHLVFANPEDRTIEGRFEIEMPPGAAISRFAMKIEGQWQEGEVVERQAARAAYEDFLHRRQDPALLENNAGNAFSARVFPIRPRERKELIVSYSQELVGSDEPYRVMLRGLPELEQLDASVVIREPAGAAAGSNLGGNVVQARALEVKKQRYRPDRDLEVKVFRPGALGLRHGRLALARVAPAGDAEPEPIGGLAVLFDTSASRALDLERQASALLALVRELQARGGGDFDLRVLAFDQDSAEIYAGKASGFGERALERLRERHALGASDLGAALQALAAAPGGATRLLLVSDGVVTAGAHEIAGLRDATRKLAEAGLRRADALVVGGIQDTSTLKAITTEDLPRDGVVIDGRLPAAAIAGKLHTATLPPLAVQVPGAAWTWPDRLEGVQTGDEVLVFADLPDDRAFHVTITGDTTIDVPVRATNTERPLLERAWIRAQIARLQAQRAALPTDDRKGRADLHAAIVDLSTRHRVLSDFTALLVLETERDYARFKIDRRALADILSVGPAGVTLVARKAPPPAPEVELPPAARGEDRAEPTREAERAPTPDETPPGVPGGAFAVKAEEDVWGGLGAPADESASGLGLVGTGRGGGGTGETTIRLGDAGLIGRGTGSGYGRGAGAGFGGRGTRVPQVRQARPEVTGSLDRDIIRRIVRAHINEIRYCYNQSLVRDPTSEGRLVIRFTVDATGAVASALVQESTMKDPDVGTCVARAIRRWRFPSPPSGDLVQVDYPFVLEYGGGLSPPSPMSPPSQEPEREVIRAPGRDIDDEEEDDDDDDSPRRMNPYTGDFLSIHQKIVRGDAKGALRDAFAWRARSPGDVLALVAIGEAAERAGQRGLAARAYGSLIDLFPARADLRRYAGNRLEGLGGDALALTIDTYRKAVESRPDHPAGHRLLAYALVKGERPREALEVLDAALKRSYPFGRFAEYDRILREDLGIIGAAWKRAEPGAAEEIARRLREHSVDLAGAPSTRFVLTWETDANDVDFHIRDGRGGHAWYDNMELKSGGELFADVTTGYGPECFAIPGKAGAYPYRFEAHYYSRGPMGYGMGKLQIVQHDGAGGLRFRERPFLIMQDDAFLDLGRLAGPL